MIPASCQARSTESPSRPLECRKSSAINTLADGGASLREQDARPHQLINFFSLGGSAFLVDLPGYGYAGVPGEVRAHWKHLVGTYVAERESLAAVVVVMDVRHPLTELDRTLLDWLREAKRGVHVLLTKADKLSKQAQQSTLARVRREWRRITRERRCSSSRA
jgi:GTP-binding protein